MEKRAAGDAEKQVIREQDESKSYRRRTLIALLFTARPQTNELLGSVIKHPAEVPPLAEPPQENKKLSEVLWNMLALSLIE